MATALELAPGGMYPRRVTSTGATRHARQCKSAFGRTDWQCHRCLELLQGAAPRDGFVADYAARKLGQQQRRFEW
jgi:hypothetical protein